MTLKANPVTLILYALPPKGETTHYILRVASAPSKCVRCAPQSGNPQPSAAEPLSPPERSDATLLHNLRRSRAPFYKTCGEAATTTLGAKGPSNLRTLRTFGTKSRQPSHRRCVQGPFPLTIPPSLYTLVNKTISEKRKPCFPYFKYKEELCIKFRKRLTNV